MMLEDSGGPGRSERDCFGRDTHPGTSTPMGQSDAGSETGIFLYFTHI